MSIVEEIRTKYRILRELHNWKYGFCDVACKEVLQYYPHLIPIKMYLENGKEELWHMILYDPISRAIIDPTSDQFGISKWFFNSLEEWISEYKKKGWRPYLATLSIPYTSLHTYRRNMVSRT